MEKFLVILKQCGYLMGRYRSIQDLRLAKGCLNSILISTVGQNCKALIEVDGKDISLVSKDCYKIDYKGVEIFLSPSSSCSGEFTAGIPGVSFISQTWAENVLRELMKN